MPSLISTKHEYIELSHTLDEDDEPPDASPSTAPIQQQQQLPVEEMYSLGPKRSASIHRHSMEALLEEANGLSSRENEESKAALTTTTTTDRKQLVFQVRLLYSHLPSLPP
jgi:solute carrier family 41